MFKLIKSHEKRKLKNMGMKCRTIDYVNKRIDEIVDSKEKRKVLKRINSKILNRKWKGENIWEIKY